MRSYLALQEHRRKLANGVTVAVCLLPLLFLQLRDLLPAEWTQAFIDGADWLRPLGLSQFLDIQVRELLLSSGGSVPKLLSVAYLDWIGVIASVGLSIGVPLFLVGIGVHKGRLANIMLLIWTAVAASGVLATWLFLESSVHLNEIGGQAILAAACAGILYAVVGAISTAWMPVVPLREAVIAMGLPSDEADYWPGGKIAGAEYVGEDGRS